MCRAINLTFNGMRTLGAVFHGYESSIGLDLSNNLLNESALRAASTSFSHSPGPLGLIMANNSIRSLPASLLNGVASRALPLAAAVLIDVTANPIGFIDPDAFGAGHGNASARLSYLTVKVHHPTAGDLTVPRLNFTGVGWQEPQSTFTLGLSGAVNNLGAVAALSTAINPPRLLNLNLSYNYLGYVLPRIGCAFHRHL